MTARNSNLKAYKLIRKLFISFLTGFNDLTNLEGYYNNIDLCLCSYVAHKQQITDGKW